MPADHRTESDGDRYEVDVLRDVRIPTAEPGVSLSGDLFLPRGAAPSPALISLLPYRRDVTALSGSAAFRWFASRGYPSLLVDLRGLGSSDGERRPPFHPGEADDAVAAVDWAAAQPWCDGTVGMWGGSYGGMTTLRAAARRPSALRAIVVLETTADPGRDFVRPGGSAGALGPLGLWSMTMLLGQLLPPLDDFDDPAEQERWRARMAGPPHLLDLFRPGTGPGAWEQGRIDLSAVDVPALCFAGWRDLFCAGTFDAYRELRGPKRIVAGPWLHTMPNESPEAPVDFLELALSWWDHRLRRRPDGADASPAVTVHVQGARPRWLGLPAWPGRGGVPVAVDTWERVAPASPDPAVGVHSGLWAVPCGPVGMPLDQHDDDTRSLCHTSPPLDEPLLLLGEPVVVLAGDWDRYSAKLTAVDSSGRSTLICAGLESSTGAGTGTGAGAGTGAGTPTTVPLAPTAYEIPAGYRLRLVVSPGDFPRVWPRLPSGSQLPKLERLLLPVASAAGTQEVRLPVPDVASLTAVLPKPTGEPLGTTAPPVWEITDDLLGGTVKVRVAVTDNGSAARHTHGRAHRVRGVQEITAVAHRTVPDAATVTVRAEGEVRTDSGHRIEVDAEITSSASGVLAVARVTLDGTSLLDRQWRA